MSRWSRWRSGGGAIAISQLTVVTRRIEPVAAKGFASRHGPGFETIDGCEFSKTVRRPGCGRGGARRENQTADGWRGTMERAFRGIELGRSRYLKNHQQCERSISARGISQGCRQQAARESE